MFPAEPCERRVGSPRKPGLVTARLVVDPGMDDPTIVTTLMKSPARFLFQHKNPRIRKSAGNGQSRRKPNNPPANNCEIVVHTNLQSSRRLRDGFRRSYYASDRNWGVPAFVFRVLSE